jgi:hypothetical protein
MADNMVTELNKTYFVRSKISYRPLSQGILPIPDGISVLIFKNRDDIKEYYENREINDPENFDILPVISFYDFMREVSEMGFAGAWYFRNFPILFGNYVSDVDIELPSFAYTYDGNFIGASGEIDPPDTFVEWKNFAKTDKNIRRVVQFASGLPFDPKGQLFTIVYIDPNYNRILGGAKEREFRYAHFPDACPLKGPYVDTWGSYGIFTDEDYAHRYFLSSKSVDQSKCSVQKLAGLRQFIDETTSTWPLDIGVNPGNARYVQGYVLHDGDRVLIKMVLGTYELGVDDSLQECQDAETVAYLDTVEQPNTFDPSFRGLQSTIKHPLKRILGTTKSTLPRREADAVIVRLLNESKEDICPAKFLSCVKEGEISSDSFLVYGFDKITGDPFFNNDEMASVCVFQDIWSAINYFYKCHYEIEYTMRKDGYFSPPTKSRVEGSHDEEAERFILSQQRLALRDLMEMIFVDGYKVEHAEMLKSYINRSSVALEIERCGYLGDLAIYDDAFTTFLEEGEDGSEIFNRISQLARTYTAKLASKIELDEKCQNTIRIHLGNSYDNLSVESRCILESALKQFKNSKQRINHDFAGISMKLCKVFERELNKLIFKRWKDNLLLTTNKDSFKKGLKEAEQNKDQEMSRLIRWLLKMDKLELGSMTHIIKRVVDRADNEILHHFKKYIGTLKNREFILSNSFLEICRLISSRYRNGGVHEKIVTYEICKEAVDNILLQEDNYLKALANI